MSSIYRVYVTLSYHLTARQIGPVFGYMTKNAAFGRRGLALAAAYAYIGEAGACICGAAAKLCQRTGKVDCFCALGQKLAVLRQKFNSAH